MKLGRNDPCSCGSGQKHKKCCGNGKATRSVLAPDVNQLFAEALQERQQGRVERAEELCANVLAANPHHAGALHELGAIALDAGRPGQAVELIRQAIEVVPGSFLYQGNLGHALHQLGLLEEAADAYGEALRLNPDSAEVLGNLGGVLLTLDRPEEALPHLRRAISLNPLNVIALTNLGLVMNRLGQSRVAIQLVRKAVDLAPQCVATVSSFAGLLMDLQRWTEALPFTEQWLSLEPESPRANQGLGNCLCQLNRKHEAARYYWKALRLKPDFLEAANNLGLCLAEGGNHEEALVLYRKVVEINPDFPLVWTNMGEAMRSLGQLEAALHHHDRALALLPGNAQVLWNRAICLLAMGRLEEGWTDYAWRCTSAGSRLRPFSYPRWDGSDPAGKTILVWMEQGLGDELLFASLLPDLIRIGAHCVVECDGRLVELLQRSFPEVEAVARTTPAHPRTLQPDIHAEISIGSLPKMFRPKLESFPQHHGYLVPDPLRARDLGQRVAALGAGLKVGICWRSGNHQEKRSKFYSQLRQWGPILTTPGVRFIRLQYDQCDEELREAERLFGTRIAAWDDLDLKDDQDGVAALISTLDLVISAGTAVDQMSGAIGAPTWLLLPAVSHLWSLGTDHSPWFPDSRPFYCEVNAPWEPVLEKIASELASLASAGSEKNSAVEPPL